MIRTPHDVVPITKEAFDTAGPVIVDPNVDYRDNHLLFEMIKRDGIHQRMGCFRCRRRQSREDAPEQVALGPGSKNSMTSVV
jgi:hypothetical protein